MYFGLFIFIILILSFWRRVHVRYSSVKFKYELYRLRDRLRSHALNKGIDGESWVFDFLDNSLSKAISQRYFITLSHLVMLSVVHESENKLIEFSEKLNNELHKSSKLKQLYEEYLVAIREYVRDQHYVSINFIIRPVAILIFGAATVATRFNSWLRNVLIYPEISDSSNFAVKFQRGAS